MTTEGAWFSYAEIARQLTVEEDRVQAVVLAYETGFVIPDLPC
jgi:hypothetical protein